MYTVCARTTPSCARNACCSSPPSRPVRKPGSFFESLPRHCCASWKITAAARIGLVVARDELAKREIPYLFIFYQPISSPVERQPAVDVGNVGP